MSKCMETPRERDFSYLINVSSRKKTDHRVQRASPKLWTGRDRSYDDPKLYLSRGLPFLYRLLFIMIQEEHSNLLEHLELQPMIADKNFNDPTYRTNPKTIQLLSSLTEEELGMLTPRQVAQVDDTGPRDAWYWVHSECRYEH